MAVNSENQTISVTLPKNTVEQLDKLAKEDNRSRGSLAAKIILDNIKKYEKKETE